MDGLMIQNTQDVRPNIAGMKSIFKFFSIIG